jgi:hypothetical protein
MITSYIYLLSYTHQEFIHLSPYMKLLTLEGLALYIYLLFEN